MALSVDLSSGALPGPAFPQVSEMDRHHVRIRPESRWPRLDPREVWHYRGLLFFLVWRDVKVRYAQTVLGAGWAVL